MAESPLADQSGLRAAARQVSLLRLLLLSIALAVLALALKGRRSELVEPALGSLRWLLFGVAAVSTALVLGVGLVRRPWQLALHLVFDLAWSGLFIHWSGGIDSPGVVILYAVILVGTLTLPGVVPFVLPSLASLVLAGSVAFHLANRSFEPGDPGQVVYDIAETNRVLGTLATQIAALFLVDLLGQLLARRLREQRLFTGELLDQLGEGVIGIDRTGTVAYVNDEAIRLLGLDPRQPAQGRHVETLLAAPHLAEVRALAAVEQGPVLRRISGPEARQLVLRLTELVDRRGRPIGRTLLVADETRLRVLEDSAQRAEHLAALGEMAAGIAHEVRNPLTSLRGCAQELAEIEDKEGNRDAADLARILVSESDRLARIVEDFLAFSRLREPKRGPTDLRGLIEDARRQYERVTDLPPGIRLEFRVADGCPTALADPDQLRQILGNLIANALDAVRLVALPRLTVEARAAAADNVLGGDAVELTVSDNGCGIPLELQERVFTPFFSTKSQGTGLGLALVQRLVREHEGVLALDSAPQKGTTVRILLPVHSQTRVFQRALGGR